MISNLYETLLISSWIQDVNYIKTLHRVSMKSQKPKKFVAYEIRKSLKSVLFNSPRADHGRGEKIKLNFCFHISLWRLKKLYGSLDHVSKDFIKALKTFIQFSEAPQRDLKKKLIFLIQLSEMQWEEGSNKYYRKILQNMPISHSAFSLT